jgi:hypothetical protein
MKKAIIHIGGHKTGSTSIQKALFDSSQNLLERNIFYPVDLIFEKNNLMGQHFVAWDLSGRHFEISGLIEILEIQTSLENLYELIKHSQADLILSSEEFMWLDSNAIERLGRLLQEYEIYVVLYVRRQDHAALGLYQTDIVYSGQVQYFNEWFKERANGFDYMSIAERWSNSLNSNVLVRPYNRDTLVDGDVVADFELVVNNVFQQKVRLIRPTYDLNQTIPSNITSMIRYYNSAPDIDKIVPALRSFGEFLASKRIKSTYELISSIDRNNILQHYFESNISLAKKYLNSSELWFEDKMVDGAETDLARQYQFQGGDLLEMINQTMEIIKIKS